MLGVAPAGGMGVDIASGSRAKGDPLDRRILLGGRARGQNGVSCGQGAIPGFSQPNAVSTLTGAPKSGFLQLAAVDLLSKDPEPLAGLLGSTQMGQLQVRIPTVCYRGPQPACIRYLLISAPA